MSTLNGTGTKYYGWQPIRRGDPGAWATKWFVLFYVPVLPLARVRMRVLTDRANEGFFGGAVDHYEVLERSSLAWDEVLRTWLSFLSGLAIVVLPFLAFLWISGYQNAQRELGKPHNALLGIVGAACLLFSLIAAIAVPMTALRRSRG
jgi:hypothetical protein